MASRKHDVSGLIESVEEHLGMNHKEFADLVGVREVTDLILTGGTPGKLQAFLENPQADGRESKISPETAENVKRIYRGWKAKTLVSEALPEETYTPRTAQSGEAHFKSTSLFAKLIRWKDRSACPDSPFACEKVGMKGLELEIPVFDEAILYRQDVFHSPFDGELTMDAISSGALVVAGLRPEQPSLNVATYKNTKGGTAHLRFRVRPNQSEIIYVTRIFNGFQKGDENLAVKQFHNSTTDSIHLSVDFEEILTEAKFSKTPRFHQVHSDGAETEVHGSQTEDMPRLWHASISPDYDSRLRLSWSLESR